ncbi:hypothetical protein ABT160_16490 [Streptomyces sp. NPDC001941]|uniref:hypothetical protein n=1 Tax=Streptomyces sp. NPDC001941 TaxID=3154659 RepID=UPI003332DC1A
MNHRVRDPEAERSAVRAAAARLLAGTPERATPGRLNASALIIESGVRRDVVYAFHRDLVEEFRADAQRLRQTA